MSKEIEKSFNKTISSESIDLVKDYIELGLDSVISDGLLKDVPIMGTLVGLFKLGSSIKDRHTAKKILRFLNQLADIPVQERERFASELNTEDEYHESVSEKVLLIVERLDETKKAEIVGNLFKLYILDVINKEYFLRLSGIVERAMLYDLLALHYTYSWFKRDWGGVQPYDFDQNTKDSLRGFGLMEQKAIPKANSAMARLGKMELDVVIEYSINHLAQELANFMFYDFEDSDFNNYVIDYKESRKEREKYRQQPFGDQISDD